MGRGCCIPGHKTSQGQLLPATRTQFTAKTHNQRRHTYAITFLFFADFSRMATVFICRFFVITISAFSDINHAGKDARPATARSARWTNRAHK
jgi:hypothetical protein